MQRGTLAVAIALVACADDRRADPPSPAPPPSVEPHAVASAAPSSSAPAKDTAANAVASSTAPPTTGPQVSTTRWQSWIHEKPSRESAHVGWFRVGTRIARGATPVQGTGCPGKWWPVEPRGFVCEGHDGVTTNLDDPTVVAFASMPPDANAPLPFGYATSNHAPLYVRVPTAKDQKIVEGDVAAHLARVEAQRAKMDPSKLPPSSALPVGKVPSFLEGHVRAPDLLGAVLPKDAISNGWAWSNMRLALISAFESEGRTFYLTTEGWIVPADRMRAARLADFRGVELSKPGEPGEHLPMIWVRWKPVKVHRLENGHAIATDVSMPFQAHGEIAPKERVVDGTRFYELLAPPAGASGQGPFLVRVSEVSRIDASTELPYMVGPDDLWIEVSILRQTLVLHRGLTPLFVTLVSTGVDGVADPETTRATPRGQFRLQSKHMTWRMAGDEHPPWKEGDKPDPRYRIDDVPWVQYFHGGYALHAAFWHDAFGQPKSHGCINLSPRDALWLFGKTEPKLPDGWHGVYGGRGGALGTFLVVRAY